jgi:hypothetical protein
MPLPLHPAIVHLPLGLAFAVPVLATGLLLGWRTQRLPRTAFALLVALQALLVGGGVVSLQLGERDSKRVEKVVDEKLVDAHEDRAELFVWTAGAVLAASVALLLVPAGAVTGLAAAVTLGAVVVAVLGARAGEAGGELVYRHGAARAWTGPPADGAATPPRSRSD